MSFKSGPEIPGVVVNNIAVHRNIFEVIIHIVMIPSIYETPVGTNPASPSPAMVIGTGAVPIPIPVEP